MDLLSSPTILDMSNELIYKICRHPSFNDLINFLFTCRHIHSVLISDSCLWRQSEYNLFLTNDQNRNIARINALMLSPLFPYCTRLRVEKLNNGQNSECIPTIFFSYLLTSISHQLRELCLLHIPDDDAYKFYSYTTNCSRYSEIYKIYGILLFINY